MSGKAIAQAVHAHFIVDAALNALILKSVLNVPLPAKLKHQRVMMMMMIQTLLKLLM